MGISLPAGLATVVFLAGTNFITRVLCANDNLMPLAIVPRMIRIVADGVLTAKFGGNFVQHLVDRVGVWRPRRNQPRLGPACRREHVQHSHVCRFRSGIRRSTGKPAAISTSATGRKLLARGSG